MIKLAEKRSQRILSWLPAIIWAGFIFFLSAQHETPVDGYSSADMLFIIGHLVLYAILMVLIVIALRRSTTLPVVQTHLIAFAIVALYAFSDEFHQSFVPGRDPTAFDWIVDMAGAFLIWLLLLRRELHSDAKPGR
jgi:VanZ family protein